MEKHDNNQGIGLKDYGIIYLSGIIEDSVYRKFNNLPIEGTNRNDHYLCNG